MENLEKSKVLTLHELSQKLNGAGIDVSEWGKGQAKTLAHLLEEIDNRETVLVTGEQGELLRKVVVATADIFYVSPDGKKYRLKEDRQIFKDGRERKRNLRQSLSEKMKLGEDPKDAIVRGVREELNIQGEIFLTEKSVDKLLLSSPSYPGLQSQYIKHNFETTLDDRQFKIDGYVEQQNDKNTFFIWEEIK